MDRIENNLAFQVNGKGLSLLHKLLKALVCRISCGVDIAGQIQNISNFVFL